MVREHDSWRLAQDWEAEARADGEVEGGHLLQGGMELRVATRFQRNYEWERGLVEAWVLQHGVDVQVMRGENLCQPGNDSGLVAHEEAQVPGGFEIAAGLWAGDWDGDFTSCAFTAGTRSC